MKIIKIDCCANCVYLVNSCIHDKFPKDKEINDFSIIDTDCPLEDLKEISLCKRYIVFLNWMINDSILPDVFANPKKTVNEYLKSINESSSEALTLTPIEQKDKSCHSVNYCGAMMNNKCKCIGCDQWF